MFQVFLSNTNIFQIDLYQILCKVYVPLGNGHKGVVYTS